MKKLLGCILAGSLLAAASPGFAEIKAGSFSVSPYVGGYTFDGTQHLRTRPTYGIRSGYNFTPNFGLEGLFGFTKTESTRTGGENDVNAFNYRLEALYHFMPESRFVPFIAAGAGATSVDYPNGSNLSDKTNAVFGYGAGFKFFITEAVALRADVRHLLVTDRSRQNIEYTAGLCFPFGGAKPAPAPVAMEREPEPAPVKKMVETPAPAKLAEPERDSDGDGVVDSKDKCPDTPKGVAVDEDGCPRDSDGDGVPDYLDKCPNTPKGVSVDKNGCPEKVCITLKVEFDTDKATIRPKYYDELKKVADYLKDYPEAKAVIEGHTDNVAGAAYNLKLSQRRAESVKKYLVQKFGIAASRLTAKGYGLTKPIASNDTEEGRQRNRRVTAVIDCGFRKK